MIGLREFRERTEPLVLEAFKKEGIQLKLDEKLEHIPYLEYTQIVDVGIQKYLDNPEYFSVLARDILINSIMHAVRETWKTVESREGLQARILTYCAQEGARLCYAVRLYLPQPADELLD